MQGRPDLPQRMECYMNSSVGTAWTSKDQATAGVAETAPSAIVALYLAHAIPEAAAIRVNAAGPTPSTWRGVALDATGECIYLPFENSWARRIVRANPGADWSQGALDFALPSGELSPSGLAQRYTGRRTAA